MKYKLFGNTGVPVSEIVLGASNFGTRRGYGASLEEIQQILSTFADAGGNFIDLADQYQYGEAEEIVGRFISSERQNFVLCTKYTRSSQAEPLPANEGNHRKAMIGAVEASLRRLKTDYIDIYMPHYDDGRTPVEEIARGLENLLQSGKIVYAGLANFPAWKASAIASHIPLKALQVEYNLLQRSADLELFPMADYFGLGTMVYSPLAGGLLTGKYRKGEQGRITTFVGSGEYKENTNTTVIIDLLESIAKELNASPGQIALAWLLTKNRFPIIGTRKLSHLDEGLKALRIELTPAHIESLERAGKIELGYPHDLLKTVQKIY